ncbi:DMT family transporter [Poseidonocella sedimentorum]|uniref:Permease of the drug/metabolite transporter (DMT) superfamily n=1 Tax=Poseidonocella sedimentorum TaxID=871652 RepID=A0A1I6DGC9_9RHOB|nr:DMT family transporter [Poseidonocella sedimentorum]SFR04467.1 Permease of the drug/metabolite transporter (DMT) superfamily [Poseidonocella sedimentorum]
MTDSRKAALWMTGAILSFSTMAMAGRAISSDLDTFEIMLYRSLVGVVIVAVAATVFGTRREISPRHMQRHVLRNLAHFGGQNLWFYAVAVIPLAQVAALEFTAPLWVLLLSVLFLGEHLTRRRLLAALLGFAGVLVVARPSPETLSLGVMAAASCAIFFAVTAILTRKLTEFATITCILFWLTVTQSVFGVIAAGYDGDIAWPAPASMPLLALIACCGLSAHFCLTTALRLAPASFVMPLDFARLPVIAVAAALIFAEPLDPFVLLGAAIILCANYLNLTTGRSRPVMAGVAKK